MKKRSFFFHTYMLKYYQKNKKIKINFQFFSDIFGIKLRISLFSKRHIIKHKNAQLYHSLTYPLSPMVQEIPIQVIKFATPCRIYSLNLNIPCIVIRFLLTSISEKRVIFLIQMLNMQWETLNACSQLWYGFAR